MENETNKITVLIRSKIDKNFKIDISYDIDKNGLIYKVESQGDFVEKMNNEDFLNLIINTATGKEINFIQLTLLLSKLPELYVKDVV